jgi:hypothetical protein
MCNKSINAAESLQDKLTKNKMLLMQHLLMNKNSGRCGRLARSEPALYPSETPRSYSIQHSSSRRHKSEFGRKMLDFGGYQSLRKDVGHHFVRRAID